MKKTNNHLEIKYYGIGYESGQPKGRIQIWTVPNLLVKESFQQINLSIFKEKNRKKEILTKKW